MDPFLKQQLAKYKNLDDFAVDVSSRFFLGGNNKWISMKILHRFDSFILFCGVTDSLQPAGAAKKELARDTQTGTAVSKS